VMTLVRPPSILLVDDHEDSREMISTLLEIHGFATVQASDGMEALAALDAGPLPALIILDWLMPGMDGASVLAALERVEAYAAIPVVIVSARASLDGSGLAAHVLVKPIHPDALLEIVREHCAKGGELPADPPM
jgi:CheY-like chemotaxis protein